MRAEDEESRVVMTSSTTEHQPYLTDSRRLHDGERKSMHAKSSDIFLHAVSHCSIRKGDV